MGKTKCSWYRVECTNDGLVDALLLSIMGTLPIDKACISSSFSIGEFSSINLFDSTSQRHEILANLLAYLVLRKNMLQAYICMFTTTLA